MKDNNTYKETNTGIIGTNTRVPFLPLRGEVLLPDELINLEVGREKSIAAINEAMENDRMLFIVGQIDPFVEDPIFPELFSFGTMGYVKQLTKMPDGTVKILIQGKSKGRLINTFDNELNYACEIETMDLSSLGFQEEIEACRNVLLNTFKDLSLKDGTISNLSYERAKNAKSNLELVGIIVMNIKLHYMEKYKLLLFNNIYDILYKAIELVEKRKEVFDIELNILNEVRENIDKSQKEYYLREQMKVIKKELNESYDVESEAASLLSRLKAGNYPDYVLEKCEKEIKKYEVMNPNMAETQVTRNYIEWLLDLPWSNSSDENYDLDNVKKILDSGHSGLEKIKERILEFLAVKKLNLNKNRKSPILCFVGPPGVGKTSLGSAIGSAIGREFIRISLGGVKDESEIRGHRRTYVAAMPGRIIRAIKDCGTKNPVVLLDEIDKLGSDFKGDPSAALLEVLDPEQNKSFSDNFIEIPFDLSDVMFITTANYLYDIPRPLRDRMEIIELSSYTEMEKKSIFKKHLLKKQIMENGLDNVKITFDDPSIKLLINGYTRESGVRSLERQIGAIMRKIAIKYLNEGFNELKVTKELVYEFLGKELINDYKVKRQDRFGVVNGLAVSGIGGDVLPLEGNIFKNNGKGAVKLTGQLGDVMKESFEAAFSYLRSIAIIGGSLEDLKVDLHIHGPEGAIKKDGPSAGVAMCVLLSSLFLNKKIKKSVAMTGEITIHGDVLPIGGVKEKLIGAYKNGIKTVLLPIGNEKDLEDVPQEVLTKLDVILIKKGKEALKIALDSYEN